MVCGDALWRSTVSPALPHPFLRFVLHRRPFAFFSAKFRTGCLETLTLLPLPREGCANCTKPQGAALKPWAAVGHRNYTGSSKDIFSSHLHGVKTRRTPSFPTWNPVRCDRGWYSRKLILIIFFVIILWGVRMPRQPFLIEGYDNLWALDISFLGRDQISLIRVLPFH